jgi:hypothetical protein
MARCRGDVVSIEWSKGIVGTKLADRAELMKRFVSMVARGLVRVEVMSVRACIARSGLRKRIGRRLW